MTVRELRIQRKMTQDDLARVSGIKMPTLVLLDRGISAPDAMNFKTACQLAQGFGMTVDELARKLCVK